MYISGWGNNLVLNSNIIYPKNINEIIDQYKLRKYIVLFPFCSPHLTIKKWPHYNKFIELVRNKFNNEYKILVAPGPLEIPMAKDINATSILKNDRAVNYTIRLYYFSSCMLNCDFLFLERCNSFYFRLTNLARLNNNYYLFL